MAGCGLTRHRPVSGRYAADGAAPTVLPFPIRMRPPHLDHHRLAFRSTAGIAFATPVSPGLDALTVEVWRR